MPQLKTIIADDHPISRSGLKLVLETTDDFLVIGEASSGLQAVEMCNRLKPDLVLMDISMPNSNGIEATKVLQRQVPATMIIVISAFQHEKLQREALLAGAIGYISKSTEFPKMLEMIRSFIYGSQVKSNPSRNDYDLTPMEQKILYLLAEGKDRQQIADSLTISINTAKMHFRNLYQKLGVDNATDAIKEALKNHLIS